MFGRRIGIVPHRIVRSFYLRYPYQTVDEKFLPEKTEWNEGIYGLKSPVEINDYLENHEIGGKIKNKSGEIRFDGHYSSHVLECLVVGRNYYGQCGYVDNFEYVEVNVPNYLDRAEGKRLLPLMAAS